jgi:uracil-DNA glycosylase family 4
MDRATARGKNKRDCSRFSDQFFSANSLPLQRLRAGAGGGENGAVANGQSRTTVRAAMAQDSAARNRLRLWLRSERALGLRSILVTGSGDAPAVEQDETPGDAGDVEDEQERIERQAVPPAPSEARVVPPPAARCHPAEVGPDDLFVPAADQPAFDALALTAEDKRARLVAMDDKEVRGCAKCRLCETRRNTVFGEGDPAAQIFFIGEGPGETEDQTGRPFVGRAGEMLNKWIAAMGLRREQVYIANIVKCRPPGNRVPAPDEVATCTPYLQRQLEIVRPKVIVTLGLPSSKYMLQSGLTMGKLRGQWHAWRGIKLMPTFHPAYVLRNPSYETRSAVWSDLKKVMGELGMVVPSGNKSS